MLTASGPQTGPGCPRAQMEAPEQYPYPPAHPSHFLRRYHALLVAPNGPPRPLPAAAREWMAQHYQQNVALPVSTSASLTRLPSRRSEAASGWRKRVVEASPSTWRRSRCSQAKDLLRAAAVAASTGASHAEESVVANLPGGSATAPGRPAWLPLSDVWASPEARAMEAACVVMKQALDLQAIQVRRWRPPRDELRSSGRRKKSTTMFVGVHV